MSLVIGMGTGLFVLLIFSLISAFLWYCAGHTKKSFVYKLIIFIVMFLLSCFFYFAPKGEDVDEYGNKTENDAQFWSRFVIGLFLFVIALPVSMLAIFLEWATVPIRNSKPQDAFIKYTQQS